MVGADCVDRGGIARLGDRDWGRRDCLLVSIANQTPQRRNDCDANLIGSPGGTFGAPTTGPLAGITFGPNGSFGPLPTGTPLGGGLETGGGGLRTSQNTPLIKAVERWNVAGRASFDVSDALNLYAEASFGRAQPAFNIATTGDPLLALNYTMHTNNPYLPTTLRSRRVSPNHPGAGRYGLWGRRHPPDQSHRTVRCRRQGRFRRVVESDREDRRRWLLDDQTGFRVR